MIKDSLLIDSRLPLEFWAEVMDTANYLRNRLSTKSQRGELIPDECWTGKKQDVSHVKVFGSTVSVVIPREKSHKSDVHKNWQGIFIGYSQDTTKHVRAWAPKTQQILLVSNPYVDKSEQGAKLLLEHFVDISRLPAAGGLKRKTLTSKPRPRGRLRKIVATVPILAVVDTSSIPINSDSLEPSFASADSGEKKLVTEESAKGSIFTAEKIMSAIEVSSKVYKPSLYEKAISDPMHTRQWKEAIEDEIQNLENHQTWEYDNLPDNRKAVGSKWVFKVKYAPDGSIARYKARLVAQGFFQIHGIDFNETFSPTVRWESLRIFLAISYLFKLIIKQIDIVGAYLESLLSDNDLSIFMKLPPGFESFRSVQAGLVCRLLRSIYGLRQSGRLWNQKVVSFLKNLGFYALNADASILIHHGEKEDDITMISVYVDDFLLASKYRHSMDWMKSKLKNEYNVKEMGEVKTIIG